MSLRSESSYLDTTRNPESSYADSDNGHPDRDVTSSPDVEESSQDEYTATPPKKKTSTVYSTPTTRSDRHKRISDLTRDKFIEFCVNFYHTRHCLVTQIDSKNWLQVAHVVPRKCHKDDLMNYEYCLGLEYNQFHVDSRRNLLSLSQDMHRSFDSNEWFLLPDAHTLEEVRGHITAVMELRNGPTPNIVPSYQTKWALKSGTGYTFVAISCSESFYRKFDGVLHHYPYPELPPLNCHVSPPLTVINAGRKFNKDMIDRIVLGRYPQQTEESEELKQRLGLLCDIYTLLVKAKDAAKAWGRGQGAEEDQIDETGKRKREQSDAGQTSGRSTRSKTRAEHGGEQKRKRSLDSSGATLTEYAVSHLEKRQKADNWETSIRRWVVESTRASSLDPELPLDLPSGITNV